MPTKRPTFVDFSMVRDGAARCMIITAVVLAAGCVTYPPPPPHPPKAPLWVGTGFPSLDGYYPAESLPNHEEGTALVHICVSPNGHLAEPPKIIRSTGSPHLDAAALRFAQATSGHWVVRAADGGRLTATCGSFPVRFHYPYVD